MQWNAHTIFFNNITLFYTYEWCHIQPYENKCIQESWMEKKMLNFIQVQWKRYYNFFRTTGLREQYARLNHHTQHLNTNAIPLFFSSQHLDFHTVFDFLYIFFLVSLLLSKIRCRSVRFQWLQVCHFHVLIKWFCHFFCLALSKNERWKNVRLKPQHCGVCFLSSSFLFSSDKGLYMVYDELSCKDYLLNFCGKKICILEICAKRINRIFFFFSFGYRIRNQNHSPHTKVRRERKKWQK